MSGTAWLSIKAGGGRRVGIVLELGDRTNPAVEKAGRPPAAAFAGSLLEATRSQLATSRRGAGAAVAAI